MLGIGNKQCDQDKQIAAKNPCGLAWRCFGCSAGQDADLPGQAGQGGRRLVLSATLAFLLPLVLATIGAVAGGPSQGGRMICGLAGLAMGIAAAAAVHRFLPRPAHKTGQSHLESSSDQENS